MKKISKERIRRLDDWNLASLLRAASVGNIVRGYYRVVEVLSPLPAAILRVCRCDRAATKGKSELAERKS